MQSLLLRPYSIDDLYSTLSCDLNMQGLQSHAPLNPASTQALGGPSKSKDPFADLAFV